MLEFELKVRLPSLDPVRTRLARHNAQFLGRFHEHDVYYNAPHRNFWLTDEALRIRYTGSQAVITYKGAKIASSALKAREELNTAVESGEVIEAILDRLGFTRTAEVNKWREMYHFETAAISLDSVEGLGSFAEIEVMAERDDNTVTAQIRRISKEIGIEGEPILASYLELLLSKRSGVQS